ncbi:hypothetical protein J5Y03_05350 [Bacillus sp. RG28]|uniref:Spore coat protein CotO n=1 Tax=Gottfriedia endophytica TaxID=2820819 RepID=A0A940NPK8_9BACI|nr:CotO family spore coat protein [Gottfriedia endophytica]MBP0724612.1 hypothetical protein [Gottfriedia endophytica]
MVKRETKEELKPLLYVAQPELPQAKLKVQQSFVLKGKQMNNKDDFSDVELKTEPIEEEKPIEVKEKKSWKKKPFREMSIEEKVYFMINKPHYIPKVECRIQTIHDLLIGYITGYENNEVLVKVSSNLTEMKIPIVEIESIQMAGI